jgi:hypothetical protein
MQDNYSSILASLIGKSTACGYSQPMRKLLLLLGMIPVLFLLNVKNSPKEQDFARPMDALSVGISAKSIDLEVSAWDGKVWTGWETLTLASEDNPLATESNLVMFPHSVNKVRFRGSTLGYVVHPIQVSSEPVHYTLASRTTMGTPRILSRQDWGADDSLLFSNASSDSSSSSVPSTIDTNRTDETPKRVLNCNQMVKDYPEDFRTAKTVYKDDNGKAYIWPRKYSPEIKLISVNHTAMKVEGDTRSPVERLRAIYQYHAKTLGWGDIGYHYLIDENGQIYEGKSGGDYVVGGHAYCANVDTIGVSLMGNFEIEKPTQVQIHSLQWLLSDLTKKYNIDPTKSVTYQGKVLPPIVGHKDLNDTLCPGYYVRESLDQIRNNVISGNLSADINLPPPPPDSPLNTEGVSHSEKYVSQVDARRQKRLSRLSSSAPASLLPLGLSVWGSNTISGRPGSQVLFRVRYHAGDALVQNGTTIGSIVRSDPSINLWLRADDGTETVFTDNVSLPRPVAPSDTILLTVKVQFPLQAGIYTVKLGGATYTLNAQGRRWMGR